MLVLYAFMSAFFCMHTLGAHQGAFFDAPQNRVWYMPCTMQHDYDYAHKAALEIENVLAYVHEHNTACTIILDDDILEHNPFSASYRSEATRTAITWASIYRTMLNTDVHVLLHSQHTGQLRVFDVSTGAIARANVVIPDIVQLEPLTMRVATPEHMLFDVPVQGKPVYVVTGGAGFIGSHVVRELVARNNHVIVVDNLSCCSGTNNIDELINAGVVTFIKHDVTVPFNVTCPVECVVHLASIPSPENYYARPIETLRSGIVGTYNCIALACDHNARLLFSSTSEVYGDPKVSPQEEEYSGNVSCWGKRAPYDQSKRFAESLLHWHYTYNDLDVRIARIFNTYGPGMCLADGRVVTNFIQAGLAGQPLVLYGSGNQTRSFSYVSDTVRGIVTLTNLPVSFFAKDQDRYINIGSEFEFTIQELAQTVTDIFKSRYGIHVSTEWALNPDVFDPKQRRPNISKARRIFNFKPCVGLKDGIENTIEYFVQQQSMRR